MNLKNKIKDNKLLPNLQTIKQRLLYGNDFRLFK